MKLSIFQKILIFGTVTLGVLAPVLVFLVLFVFSGIENSDVFDATEEFIWESEEVEQCVGRVRSIGGWLPRGISNKTITEGREDGEARINMYVVGTDESKTIGFILVKGKDQKWRVVKVNC